MYSFTLTSISPLDGRYHSVLIQLRNIFSEYALIKFRIKIELDWFIQLSLIKQINNLPYFSEKDYKFINNIYNNFNENEALSIKNIEMKTEHDVKSVEYYIKSKFSLHDKLKNFKEFIHFGCTSDDINNLSYALMLQKNRRLIILPYWKNISFYFKKLSIQYKNVPLLARTHGQPATPSTVGKEFLNFYYRLQRQIKKIKKIEILGKFNGSTGNYNALSLAYPEIDWQHISRNFVNSFGFTWNAYTTQIEPHDYILDFLSCIASFNSILIDFNRDMWGYISLNYFSQKIKKDIIGSSIMPHKINPINFENSEGNLGLSNAIIYHMNAHLPLSRWQRDLTDSTLLRNLGVIFGYSVIGYSSLLKGLKKINIQQDIIKKDLDNHWEILCEGIQTVMRKYNIKNSYESLKVLSNHNQIDKKILRNFIMKLNIPKQEKEKLYGLHPSNYIGYASKIVDFL
ncbi:Adenylosuccinate lyase [Buchnera aphidicola (Thelaxes suberi)]|uniref:adenylosuccinate lyase n=1 Tax=Buchnera aphidicola TaxID=9 RepID=UPI003464CD32